MLICEEAVIVEVLRKLEAISIIAFRGSPKLNSTIHKESKNPSPPSPYHHHHYRLSTFSK